MGKPHSPWLFVANTAHSPWLLALVSCARPRYILSVVRVTKLWREAVFITTWACSEVLGFWCGYVLPISVLDWLALITVLGIANQNPTLLISLNWLPLTKLFFFFISLCVPLPIVPFSLASLCLSGSVRQCSHLFFTFHLLSVLSIVSVVLNFVLSPFPLVFNVLAMHHAPNQPSWKPPGRYRPLLLNIQLVFNERLLLSSTLPPSPSHISYSQT